jgi:hypothetical protein
LKSGDLLFYESSKCFHGRPHTFNGSWYSSVFVHYFPKYGWAEQDHNIEKHYAVPPHWRDAPTDHIETPLKMVGTGLSEPSCPNSWCPTQQTVKWSGPAEHGYWISPSGEKFPFDPKKPECKDQEPALCAVWMGWDTNECVSNSGYMLTHCKKSCGACTPDEPNEEL